MTSEEKAKEYLMNCFPEARTMHYVSLADLFDRHADEQREICAKDAKQAAIDYSHHGLCHIKVYEACLNAMEKNDEIW